MTRPKGLGKAGWAVWRRHRVAAGKAGRLDALMEASKLADRLGEVREALAAEGLVNAKGEKHPLLAEEVKLSGQFRLYLTLLHASEKRAPGRPATSEGWDQGKVEAIERLRQRYTRKREHLSPS